MQWIRIVLLSLLVATPSQAGVRVFAIGSDADITTDPTPGLLLMGGGGDVDAAMRLFLGWVNGGDVVVLRASGSDGYNRYLYEHLDVPVNRVTTLLLTSRESSSDPEVLRTVREAEAIFLAGGDQSRYWNLWKETPLLAALNRHLAAGKPIGGTSAGLAMLGEFAYVANHTHDLTAREALRDPYHDWITLSHDFLHTSWLEGMITDSHFTERARLGRLLAWTARLSLEQGEIIRGVGIDEETALLIDRDGQATVYGNGRVYLVQPVVAGAQIEPGKPLETGAVVIALDKRSSWDLAANQIDTPAAIAQVRAKDGQLEEATEGK